MTATAARAPHAQFAEWLIRKRTLQGLTQEGLAVAVGCSVGTAGGWERGQHKPRASARKKLADALGVELGDVLAALGVDAPSEAATDNVLLLPGNAEPGGPEVVTGDDQRTRYMAVLFESFQSGRAGREGVFLKSRDWITVGAVLGRLHEIDWPSSPG